jgi:hypothetical protein
MEKKDREGQMFSLWPVLDTRLPKDVRGQFSSLLSNHVCLLISMTYDPKKQNGQWKILINLPEISGFLCLIDLARIPVYLEASLLYRLPGLLPLGRNLLRPPPRCVPLTGRMRTALRHDADALYYGCRGFA